MSETKPNPKFRWYALIEGADGTRMISRDSQVELKKALNALEDHTVKSVVRGKEFKVQTKKTFSFTGADAFDEFPVLGTPEPGA